MGAMAMIFGAASHAKAAVLFEFEVPETAFITQNGLDWAWASPVAPDGSFSSSSTLDFSFQGQFGWRLPTIAELVNAPNAADFLFPGANVPFNSTDPDSSARFQALNAFYANTASDGACAAPYFQGQYFHCDFRDGRGQGRDWWEPGGDSSIVDDSLVVRTSSTQSVPEPTTTLGVLVAVSASVFLKRKKSVDV